MFELDNFLRENENWRDLLVLPPYNLTIKEDNGYVLFKYSQIESDLGNEVVKEARGSIYKRDANRGMVCVCRPFSKFFNYGEREAARINWTKVTVTEKIDGSLCKRWWDRNEWHISTNSNIDAFKTHPSGTATSFGELLCEAANRYAYLDEVLAGSSCEYTHMFELVGPLTKVVIPYELDLYYLGSRNVKTGEYKWLKEFEVFPAPHTYNFKSIDEVLEASRMHEGFVVFDGVNRVKCKSGAYVRAHHAATRGFLTDKSLLNVVLMNEDEEFLVYCPEYAGRIKAIRDSMVMARVYATAQRTEAIPHFKGGRAEYAEWVHKNCSSEFWDFLFKCYGDRELNWEKYSKNLSQKRWENLVFQNCREMDKKSHL